MSLNFSDTIIDKIEKNETNSSVPRTTEGLLLAYCSLILMAIVPIFYGSIRSISYHAMQKKRQIFTGQAPDVLSRKDAAMFPLNASVVLISIYIILKVLGKDFINLFITTCFLIFGGFFFANITSDIISYILPAWIPNYIFKFSLIKIEPNATQLSNSDKNQHKSPCTELKFSLRHHFVQRNNVSVETGDEETPDSSTVYMYGNALSTQITVFDVLAFLIYLPVGLWYFVTKHWIANNIIGLVFSINGIERIFLNRMRIVCILMCGLLIYDVFFVFATDIMVTVAKSFNAPVKFVFPHDFLQHGINANNFSMLGLGDVVVPGLLIAFLLRFDNSLKRNGSRFYFLTCYLSYFIGLMLTIFVMIYFAHAQPALLYLVPICLLTPIVLAFLRGDIDSLFKYEDYSDSMVSGIPHEDDSKLRAALNDNPTSHTKMN